MSFELQDASWLVDVSPTQKLVLLCLTAHANDDGACWPSVARIAARSGLARRAVIYNLRRLERSGHISREISRGRVTRYRVHPCTPCTSAPDAPVHEMHTTRAPRAPDPCTTCTGPVRQMHPESPRISNEPIKNSKMRKSKASQTPEFHQAVIGLYHEILPTAPRVKAWTTTRRQALDARIRERLADGKPADQADYWRAFFETVAASDFLTGRATGFRADLEWLLRPENFLKVIEGRYSNRSAKDTRHATA